MKNSMLVVVDYQNDFVDGSLGFSGAEIMDDEIAAFIEEYICGGGIVVATRDTHSSEYLNTREGKNLPVKHCIEGENGWQIYGKTGAMTEKYSADIHFIDKYSFGISPEQMLKLKEKFSPQKILLVGLVSNICVISNVCCFQSTFPEADISVKKTATASFDDDLNAKTLDVLKGLQIEVI